MTDQKAIALIQRVAKEAFETGKCLSALDAVGQAIQSSGELDLGLASAVDEAATVAATLKLAPPTDVEALSLLETCRAEPSIRLEEDFGSPVLPN